MIRLEKTFKIVLQNILYYLLEFGNMKVECQQKLKNQVQVC